ncbi:hypothetical protein [Gordonia malaquae]
MLSEDGTLTGPVAKNISDAEREGHRQPTSGAKPGMRSFFAESAWP